jgi:transcriptional regulator with XRE-family HTH domain
MPANSPPLRDASSTALAELGQRIRAQRKQLRISATTTAEAAGMSRVTWHRIERGEPSVTMGAYLSAVSALGLELTLRDPAEPAPSAAPALPQSIRLADYPELRRVAWQMSDDTTLTPQAALDLYERNWRHVDPQVLGERERALVQQLTRQLGGGRLLV